MKLIANLKDDWSSRTKAMERVIHNDKDYGLTLYLENRSVVKCVLHMYDRDVDIEYDEFN